MCNRVFISYMKGNCTKIGSTNPDDIHTTVKGMDWPIKLVKIEPNVIRDTTSGKYRY